METNVRPAKKSDLENIISLLGQLSPYRGKIDIKEARHVLGSIQRNKDYKLVVYEDNKQIIGTALLLIQKNLSHGVRPYGHIENVVVDKNYRKKGVGTAMLQYLIKEAKKAGCYKILLACEPENERFYGRSGFCKTSEIEMRLDL